MSTAVMSSPIFDCGELFKSGGATKAKDSLQATLGQAVAGGHAPLRRSYTSLVNLIEQHRKLDRTVSEPTSRYKTELCRPFEENGSCKYGDKCQFAHGYSELRNLARHPKYKTELCRTFHKIGFCPYGPRCHFVHNFEEARIHNLKVSAQLGQPQLGPLLSPASVGLLEQLAASAAPLALPSPLPSPMPAPRQPLHRSHSLGVAPLPLAPLTPLGPLAPLAPLLSRPKPLNLSPTFSLGSAADSSSPSSSLSQSPTNSMASFFSDEAAQGLGFPQELSPSPQGALPEELASPRTPSPLSPGADSRLPVFNRISNNTLPDLEHLKI